MKKRKELNIQIGERIRKSREIAGFTQERLAEAIDVSTQYISDLERGVTGASTATLIRLCNTLNASSDYILMGKEGSQDLSSIIERIQYLPTHELVMVERGINFLLEVMSMNRKS